MPATVDARIRPGPSGFKSPRCSSTQTKKKEKQTGRLAISWHRIASAGDSVVVGRAMSSTSSRAIHASRQHPIGTPSTIIELKLGRAADRALGGTYAPDRRTRWRLRHRPAHSNQQRLVHARMGTIAAVAKPRPHDITIVQGLSSALVRTRRPNRGISMNPGSTSACGRTNGGSNGRRRGGLLQGQEYPRPIPPPSSHPGKPPRARNNDMRNIWHVSFL